MIGQRIGHEGEGLHQAPGALRRFHHTFRASRVNRRTPMPPSTAVKTRRVREEEPTYLPRYLDGTVEIDMGHLPWGNDAFDMWLP